MTEAQQLLCDISRDLWVASAKQTGRPRYLCKQRFLIYLNKLLDIKDLKYKQFSDFTDLEIAILYPSVSNLLNKIKK